MATFEAHDHSKLFVGNLPYKFRENDLAELFRAYGSVIGAKVVEDRATGKSKGFGFVTFASAAGADDAMSALRDGLAVEGRTLTVRPATQRGTGPVDGGSVAGEDRP